MFGKVLQEIETKKLGETRGKVGRWEKVPRYLFTRLGLIRFERHKVKYKEKGEDNFEAKLGIMYSGKELESKKTKHRRYRLKEKVIYGGIEGADDFGERPYIQGEQRCRLPQSHLSARLVAL